MLEKAAICPRVNDKKIEVYRLRPILHLFSADPLLAQNQIALEVARVRDDSGQTLSGQKALNLTPASDVRLETAPDQSKRAVIFILAPQTSPGSFPPWQVGP